MTKRKIHTGFLFFLCSAIAGGMLIATLVIKFSPFLSSEISNFCHLLNLTPLRIPPSNLADFVVLTAGVILLIGILSFSIQIYKTHRLLQRFASDSLRLPRKIRTLVLSLGIEDRVKLIKNHNLFSFCTGIFSSRIFITSGLVNTLTEKELEAVLLHEQAHLNHHDPFKTILTKTIQSVFFFLPLFSEIRKHMSTTSEILADSFAVSYQNNPMYLRKAIKKILSAQSIHYDHVSAIADPDYLEIRIHTLLNPAHRYRFKASIKGILSMTLFIVLCIMLLRTPTKAFSSSPSASSGCNVQYECIYHCPTPLTYPQSTPVATFDP